MIKRPNTIKMKRLLQHLVECDLKDRKQLRELQEDARQVLGIEESRPRGKRKR